MAIDTDEEGAQPESQEDVGEEFLGVGVGAYGDGEGDGQGNYQRAP